MQKIILFLKEVKAIFRQISWPDKTTLFQLTVVVISISIITSLILGGFDYLFTQSFSLLGQLQTQQQTAPIVLPQEPQASDSGQIDFDQVNLQN